MLNQFHFIRPEWLLVILPLLLLSWALLRKKTFSPNWEAVIDARLLPHLLLGVAAKSSRAPIAVFFAGGLLAILALAGPSWEKLPQPVFKEQSALVIVLDLSLSMDAADIKPSRLTRARHKITDILNLRKEGQTALIGYAADAFTISPLTDDTATINTLVPSLDTDLMPAQGSRVDLALNKAAQLLRNAGIAKGDILLITDGVSTTSQSSFARQRAAGHRISILGIGTTEGGPIPLAEGGFLNNDQGAIVLPKLNRLQLRNSAIQAGGRFSMLSADDADIKHLLGLLDVNRVHSASTATAMQADVWREQGPWLLLLLIPLAAFAFRKGYLFLLVFFILPAPQPAQALSWDELWRNDNQRAAQQFEQRNNSAAASLFTHPEWKASAHFRAGEYPQALAQLEQLENDEAHYNRGNTLAKMDRLEEAIEAYNRVLKNRPEHADARYNKQQLEQRLNNQQQDSKQQQKSADKNNRDKQTSSQQNSSGNKQENNGHQQETDAAQENNTDKNSQEQEKNAAEQNTQQSNAEKNNASSEQVDEPSLSASNQQDALSKQAREQWLRRIPDDPGGLLRNKFKHLYQQQKHHKESQAW
jgi:Ca-activated chloride channel family protein